MIVDPGHRIEINQKSASRILASSPGSFYRRLFSYIWQNVSLRNRQMSLKGKKCRGDLPGWSQYGVKMTYWWRILDMGTSFHESRTSAWSLFCPRSQMVEQRLRWVVLHTYTYCWVSEFRYVFFRNFLCSQKTLNRKQKILLAVIYLHLI